jgi:hypothetical protein
MGLDVILYTSNSEALYQKDHDYFDEHMLSQTSCRIMFRQHTVAGSQVSKNMLFSTYNWLSLRGDIQWSLFPAGAAESTAGVNKAAAVVRKGHWASPDTISTTASATYASDAEWPSPLSAAPARGLS